MAIVTDTFVPHEKVHLHHARLLKTYDARLQACRDPDPENARSAGQVIRRLEQPQDAVFNIANRVAFEACQLPCDTAPDWPHPVPSPDRDDLPYDIVLPQGPVIDQQVVVAPGLNPMWPHADDPVRRPLLPGRGEHDDVSRTYPLIAIRLIVEYVKHLQSWMHAASDTDHHFRSWGIGYRVTHRDT